KMRILLLCACMLVTTTIPNASEGSKKHGSIEDITRPIEVQIKEYEVLLGNVEHSKSPAKESLEQFYKGYLNDLKALSQRAREGKSDIKVQQELHKIYYKNNPGVADYKY